VIAALERLRERDPSVDVRRLQGRDEWRLRVGDWRVRLQLDFEARRMIVVRILPRGRAYDR
jgi:mRNA interferase RelE/StbE